MHDQLSWRDALEPGDIVAFAFPTTEPNATHEKHRPALVLAIDRSGDVAEAIVVYGTASMTRANTGILIKQVRAEYRGDDQCQLHRATGLYHHGRQPTSLGE